MARKLVVILSLATLCIYAARSVISGTILNDTFNGEPKIGEDQNVVSFWLTLATIINSQIGLAAAVAGVLHYMEWNAASRFGTVVGVAVVTMLEFFVMGLAAKQFQVGADALPGTLGGRETLLGALSIVSAFFEPALLVTVLFSSVEPKVEEEVTEFNKV